MERCPRCHGAGHINSADDDVKTGAAMRKLREAKGISLRKVASIMENSPGYLSMLEQGKQRWNTAVEARFKAAIGAE